MKESKKETNARIEALLQELTLEEKCRMIHGAEFFKSGGVDRLGIPGIVTSDGPCGVRNDFYPNRWYVIGSSADYVSYLPSNSAIASTWNRKLAGDSGRVLGREARGRGKDMILAPGINIKRNPLCGRNFEYLSEDPYLVSELVVPLIEGIQENDVSACVKHFACNNQEWERYSVNAEPTERAFRELYLPGFEAAVKKAKSLSLMGSYNLVRGEHGSESRKLLTDILRKEWKYDGLVVSDWTANHDTKDAAESGLDLEMGITDNFDDYYLGRPLVEAVKRGEIDESVVDEKIRHILRLLLRIRKIDIEVSTGKNGKKSARAVATEDRDPGYYNGHVMHAYALKTAEEAVVLLKNEKKRLPLKPSQTRKLLVIGENANRAHANGGGSAEIKALYEITPLLGLAAEYGGNTEIRYVPGYYVPKKVRDGANWQENSIMDEWKLQEKQKAGLDPAAERKKAKAMKEEAARLAKEYDDVIFIGGLDHDHDVEGKDRTDMKLPYGQDDVLNAVLDANPDTVVVMVAGSPVDMRAWKDRAKAIVYMSYNGMEGGTALARVISGTICPSGKLAETFPESYETTPVAHFGEYPGRKLTAAEKKRMKACNYTADYKEGIFVGYRYYEKFDVPVQFPFGFGLSYVDFKYSDIALEKSGDKITVSAKITNTGHVSAMEVVQLYVGAKTPKKEDPVKELKGFEKLELKAGQTKTVRFKLDASDLAHFNEESGEWQTERGVYRFSIGSSSADIRLKKDARI
ncbi:MAG: glycoside hydrolase family 3 C-terminal domain-containing protein [Lachnospiraceae bacterium]|nr:glycoside hydrolase family 3 C-terminal domain-containing protein [Lachnospiraceae bacterium]